MTSTDCQHEINDFVSIDIPVTQAVQLFQNRINAVKVATIVYDSWRRESAAVDAAGLGPVVSDPSSVAAYLSLARFRTDGMVLPLRWSGGARPFPSFTGELEIVSFGEERTHLHLRGCTELGPIAATPTERSLADRLVIAHARHLLTSLGHELTRKLETEKP